MRTWIQKHQVITLFILIYILEWSVLVPAALDSNGLLPFHIPKLVEFAVGWAPGIAAVTVSGIVGGRQAVGDLLRRLLRWRVNIGWYITALFGIAGAILAGIGLHKITGGGPVTIPAAGVPILTILLVFLVTMVVGILVNTEEIAWRGFALPRLQTGRSALAATLLIAVVEGLTHLPLGFTKGLFVQQIGLPVFMLFTIALAILYSWIYNSTRGSLLIVTLLHASQNAWSNLISPPELRPFYFTVGLFWLAALIVIAVFGPKTLSRQPAEVPPQIDGAEMTAPV